MSFFLSICLCPGFENTALNVGLYVALLMCAADLWASPLASEEVPAPALVADLFCRWGKAKGRHQTLQMWLVYPSTGSVGQLCRQWGHDPAGETHGSTARLGEGWALFLALSRASTAEELCERELGDAAGPCWPGRSTCGSGGLGTKGCAEHG